MVVNQNSFIHPCKTFDSYVPLDILLHPSENSLHSPLYHPCGESPHLSFSTSQKQSDFNTVLGHCHAFVMRYCIMDQVACLYLPFPSSIEILLVS